MTQTYNSKGDKIYPVTKADSTEYNFTGTNTNLDARSFTNVQEALNSIISKLQQVSGMVSGSNEVAQKLSVVVNYACNNDAETSPAEGWAETINLPDSDHIYTWKQTIFKWNGEKARTAEEIVAAVAFPETQFMYCSAGSDSELSGPRLYEDETSDRKSNTIKCPQNITQTTPNAYMAVRRREANQQWYDEDANNDTENSQQIRYHVTQQKTVPTIDNDTITNAWKKSIDINDLVEDTNCIYQTYAITINNEYTKSYDNKVWNIPSLLSIITI